MSLAYLWILIPLAGIAAGVIKDYLQFKEKTRRLGTSTDELERTVVALRQELETVRSERDEMIRRVENLEALVTSRVWRAVSDDRLSEDERQAEVARARTQMRPEPPPEPTPREKAERLARRLTV